MEEDYKSIFETFELDDETLHRDKRETITPTLIKEPSHAIASLPRFTMDRQVRDDADFRIVDTLGEGGMGVVSLAEQKALKRLVAIKEPKSDNHQAHLRVLDEAFIMGQVDHPNVVPAYGLGRRDTGQPILVMKRVEGTSWEDVLIGRANAPDGSEVDLAWHLRVLLQVCNALRFAHARQVVHRDIKPENVMIGEFGEVYLLDWGIALSLDPNVEEGIPSIASASGLAGTPCFMAPEMTINDTSQIDARTDVYLLGATLHLILTNQPPHKGKTLMEVCEAAYRSEPPVYSETVPSELAAIATKAMARQKNHRWDAVTDFARAISGYLEHKASYQLSDAAHELLSKATDKDNTRDATNQLLEAEFGFRQALTIWENNLVAKKGLQKAIEAKVVSAIEREELGSARAALEQLPQPNAQLAQLVETLAKHLQERAQHVSYLEQFERDLDLRTGAGSRQKLVSLFGATLVILCLMSAWFSRPGQPPATYGDWMTGFWRMAAIAGLSIILLHKQLLSNIANRRLLAYFVSSLIGLFMIRFAATMIQPPQTFILISESCIAGMCAAAIGVSTNRKLSLAAFGYAFAGLITAITQQLWIGYLAIGSAHALFFGYTAWLWRSTSPAR